MYIKVKNKNPLKAYKLLMKKLRDDGFFKELRDSRYYRSKSEKLREKRKAAIARNKKDTAKRERILLKEENSFWKFRNKKPNSSPPRKN